MSALSKTIISIRKSSVYEPKSGLFSRNHRGPSDFMSRTEYSNGRGHIKNYS